jgi:hypothetical protein
MPLIHFFLSDCCHPRFSQSSLSQTGRKRSIGCREINTMKGFINILVTDAWSSTINSILKPPPVRRDEFRLESTVSHILHWTFHISRTLPPSCPYHCSIVAELIFRKLLSEPCPETVTRSDREKNLTFPRIEGSSVNSVFEWGLSRDSEFAPPRPFGWYLFNNGAGSRTWIPRDWWSFQRDL